MIVKSNDSARRATYGVYASQPHAVSLGRFLQKLSESHHVLAFASVIH